MDGEAVSILVGNLGFDEFLVVRPKAKAGDVPGEHVIFHLAGGQPLRHHQAHARRLREARDDAATNEIVLQLRHRTQDHVTVGRPDHRAVDHPLDARLGGDRHAVHSAHDVVHDPVQIIGK